MGQNYHYKYYSEESSDVEKQGISGHFDSSFRLNDPARWDRPAIPKRKINRNPAVIGVIIAIILLGAVLGVFVFLIKNKAGQKPNSFVSMPGNSRTSDFITEKTPEATRSYLSTPTKPAFASTPTVDSRGATSTALFSRHYESVDTYRTPVSPTKTYDKWCPGTMLKVGNYAFVNPPTGGATLRDGPYGRLPGHETDRVYPGAIFEVIEGPICDARVNMYKLRTSWDTEYWAPEAPYDASEWWLLPLHLRQVCSDAMPTRLLVGMQAFVLEEPFDPVEVYPEPVVDLSKIIYKIWPTEHDRSKSVRQETEIIDLLNGPHCDGKGANWWYIRLENGTEGWIRESSREHDYYYIGPYFSP